MAKLTSAKVSRPGFIADPASITRSAGGRQVDWPNVPESYRPGSFTVTVATGGAAIGAVSIPVVALPQKVMKGTVLRFSIDEFATVTADTNAGATALPVEALVTAVEAGDVATVAYESAGKKHIKAGTVMCELASGKVVPRAVRPGAETAIGIIETAADEESASDALSGYGIIKGGVLYENMLPDATGGPPKVLPAQFKTELQTAGVGTGFAFEVYADSRAD